MSFTTDLSGEWAPSARHDGEDGCEAGELAARGGLARSEGGGRRTDGARGPVPDPYFEHRRAFRAALDAAGDLRSARAAFEIEFILRILRDYNGNVSRAAKAMGVTRRNLQVKLQKVGILLPAGRRSRRELLDSVSGHLSVS